MKMSTKGRYAVMAMIDIATHSEGEDPNRRVVITPAAANEG